MLALPGYAVTDVIYEDSATIIYRGAMDETNAPVILKTTQQEQPGAREAARLHHEYAILAELAVPGLARVHDFRLLHNRPVLVLNDIGGQPLTSLIAAGPCPLATFFAIAAPLTAILGQLHDHRIIHKDIKPHNIIYNARSGELELIDFGLASRLSHEHPYLTNPHQIEGTFAYLSPEQTGRMNRVIDYRCDFYSLGVTFYQLLTGQLPFQAGDPLEWVHCHIARTPRPADAVAPGVPPMVAAVVRTLLAKLPEERYQSAQGLLHDLNRCRAAWEAGDAAPFALRARDVADRFQIPQTLYGRDQEAGRLLAAFERMAATGQPALVVVAGYAGIGKSTLAQELYKPITRAYGQFVTGKADQYRRDIPYATISTACAGLIQQVLGQSAERVAGWRERLQAAVGPNGQVLIDLIPQVELIIGPQGAVPDLPLMESQNRFQRVFQNFLGVFARPEQPLVMFLDDLQWLDSASLALLKHIIASPETRYLLVIAAYRDNEVDAAHPLRIFLDELRSGGIALETIALEPLPAACLHQLIADTLRCTAEEAAPLVRVVAAKTLGNPFFSIQFLTALHREGLIAFDRASERWTWDLPAIQAQNFTDNVAEFMIGELQRLPQATQQSLQVAACLGQSFDVNELALLGDQSLEAVIEDLWAAADCGLVVVQQDTGRFLHDRVHEAAYSLIPAQERAPLHLRIGRWLLAPKGSPLPPAQSGKQSFRIVNHLNQSAGLLSTPDERHQLADLNLRAGMRARASTAYASAADYLATGIDLLPAESWETAYDLTFGLHRYRADCEYLLGNGALAEAVIATLLAHARNATDAMIVATVQAQVYTAQIDFERAVKAGLAGLERAGLVLPLHPTAEDGPQAYAAVWAALGERPIEALLDLPLTTDPQQQAMLNLLSSLQSPVATFDPQLLFLTLCHGVRASIEGGNADGSTYLYVVFGFIVGRFLNDMHRGMRFARVGYDLVEQRGLGGERAKVYGLFGGTINSHMRHHRTSPPILQKGFTAASDDGDILYATFISSWRCSVQITLGAPLDEVFADLRQALSLTRRNKISANSVLFVSQQYFIQRLRGMAYEAFVVGDTTLDQTGFEAHLNDHAATFPAGPGMHACYELMTCVIEGDFDQALRAAIRGKPFLWTIYSLEFVDYYYFAALAISAVYPRASAADQADYRAHLTEYQQRFAAWAEDCPDNFLDGCALIAAEIARIDGDDLAAEQGYETAIRAARDGGFVHKEAIALECAARFYAARGFQRIAEHYWDEARECYARWGAAGKVRQLDAAHPGRRARPSVMSGNSTSTSLEDLDVLAIIKASQAISGEIVLGSLLETLVRTVLEQAGARRGDLLLVRDGVLTVAATAQASQEQIHVQTALNEPVSSQRLPIAVLNYVLRSRESVIIGNPAEPHQFVGDTYLSQHQVGSLLCVPIIRQSTVLGLLYLENDLITHAFTPERLVVLDLLGTQAAISLENALLYDQLEDHNRTLEDHVAQRTADLHTALARVEAHTTDLKGANLRLEGLLHFARFMQHEVRGYAAGLEGLTPLLRQALLSHPQGDQYGDHLAALEDTVAQMNDLTQRMLILTREGTLPHQQQRTVALRPLLEQVCAKTRAFADRSDLPVTIELAVEPDLAVAGDPLYLGMAVYTGLRNAVEVMAEHETAVAAAIVVEAVLAEGTVRIGVRDNGPGYPPALLEAIAVARRSEGEIVLGWSNKSGGSGLGLALMDRVAQLHGGRLELGNRTDQPGAWFDLNLPGNV